jgi:hypothetical protein
MERMKRSALKPAWMLAATAAIAGCEMSATSMPTECVMLGAQCRLASGPLGVCENVACKEGEAGPCFHCSDQH